ncbi:hypothetical protein SG34_009140 [Thalassomonas viridans]|uniref:Uncharacterized protein n=1 Tax=Thalassomonas viridans TaxID=137584 RepID=A0AAE9Z6J7_9GAMM|nr:hypothetical protein [Thalassomonas viridans]WDE04463.1 hypothetical protein SG34_024515 [Thalassomonas viridans]WDE07029.1 hypothetical protein SG34_009140 [Thalassomonas viridans]
MTDFIGALAANRALALITLSGNHWQLMFQAVQEQMQTGSIGAGVSL